MPHYPVYLDLTGKPVLVVGGGQVAERKIERLLACGAKVTLIAPQIRTAILQMTAVRCQQRPFEPNEPLAGYALVFACTDDSTLNQQICQQAGAEGIWANAATQTNASSFISPSVVQRGRVSVAIASSGSAPVLSRWLRGIIEAVLPAQLAAFSDYAATERERVKARVAAPQRRRVWERFCAGIYTRLTPAQALTQAVNEAAQATPLQLLQVEDGQNWYHRLSLADLHALQSADYVFVGEAVAEGLAQMIRLDAQRLTLAEAERLLADATTHSGRVLLLLGQLPTRLQRQCQLSLTCGNLQLTLLAPLAAEPPADQ